MKLSSLLVVLPLTVHLGSCSAAFKVVWNAPSQGCSARGSNVTIADYGVTVNPKQAFIGSEIALMYTIGSWPTLTGTKNATACWEKRHAAEPCSWNPWGKLEPETNGGVPQSANLSSHVAAIVQDLTAAVPVSQTSNTPSLNLTLVFFGIPGSCIQRPPHRGLGEVASPGLGAGRRSQHVPGILCAPGRS